MKQLCYFIFLFIFALQFSSCIEDHADHDLSILPLPQEVEDGHGFFARDNFKIFAPEDDRSYYMNVFSDLGWDTTNENKEGKANVVIKMDYSFKEEAYELIVERKKILIRASSRKGVFYAIQSLKQLVWLNNNQIPNCKIKDEPRFSYRGMHLDVARHFHDLDFVKRYIDVMAMYKYNYFHWHLTEDQGWRIEIKKYPRLQEIAAYRDETLIGHYTDQPHQFDGKKYGGYYTQEEIKELVAYAESKQIVVIPEIEMPGHSLAALAAYPELGCSGGPYKVATKWGVFEDVYCPTEKSFAFLEDVIDEVAALFPGPYIHIGGDECPKKSWKESAFCQRLIKQEGLKDEHELQSYFIQKMEKYINQKGKKIIGWDEILEGGLAPNATVMSWRGIQGGIDAAQLNHEVIMTPTSHCYFDYYQSTDENEPLAIGGYLPLEKVYSFEPIPDALDESQQKYIKGAQGNVWTEYMPTTAQVEYMAFPRAIALAEVVWSAKTSKNYDRFLVDVEKHIAYLSDQGINVANHLYVLDLDMKTEGNGVISVSARNLPQGCSLAAKDSFGNYIREKQFELSKNTSEFFMLNKDGKVVDQKFVSFDQHNGFGAKVDLYFPPSEKYKGFGSATLVNGILADGDSYGGKEWLGFQGESMIATLNFGEMKTLNYGSIQFFNSPDSWIYPPRQLILEGSADGENWKTIIAENVKPSNNKSMLVELPTRNITTQYLRITALPHGEIKSGQGEGNQAWLFVGEIVL